VEFVVFDMDGTIVEFNIPVDEIRRRFNIRGYILEDILKRENRDELLRILESYEIEAAKRSRLYAGVREFTDFLRENGVVTAVYTRNSKKSVKINLERHKLNFDYIFTREDAIKPSPDPILKIIYENDFKKERCVMIGDYFFDYQTARNAGIKFWLFVNEKNRSLLNGIPYDLKFNCYFKLLEKARQYGLGMHP